MEIADSARKHGVADDDIVHAVANPVRLIRQDERRVLYIGADRAGAFLEVVVADDERIIHAMALRPKFLPYLDR